MAELQNPQACRNGCGTQIGFHEKWKSKNGKPVPIEVQSDGKWKRHDCPNSAYQKKPSNPTPSANPDRLSLLEARVARIEESLANQG